MHIYILYTPLSLSLSVRQAVYLQLQDVTVFVSRVMAASRAKSLPVWTAFWPVVIEVFAMTTPLKLELAPNVAEVPTCQKTLQGEAPFSRMMEEPTGVMTVVVVLNMKRAPLSPLASNRRILSKVIESEKQYTPGVSVWLKPRFMVVKFLVQAYPLN